MLQMMYDALVLVHLDANVRVSLAGNSARLYERCTGTLLVGVLELSAGATSSLLCVAHVVASLSC